MILYLQGADLQGPYLGGPHLGGRDLGGRASPVLGHRIRWQKSYFYTSSNTNRCVNSP
jgi:hypothetical protein